MRLMETKEAVGKCEIFDVLGIDFIVWQKDYSESLILF
jgi:hypothetical protein